MDIYLLGLVAIALLVIILLIVYLTSKVNDLEKETLTMASRLQEAAHQSSTAQGPFAGLSGQTLWDALCGAPPENIDAARLEEVRQRYEAVLIKHIQSLFEEGRVDGQMGASGTPKNKQKINVLRGSVESWLPQEACNAIYQCGMDSAVKTAAEADIVRVMLDDVCSSLYAKVGLELRQAFSDLLMPEGDTDEMPA